NKFCGDGLIGLRYAVLATILYVQSLRPSGELLSWLISFLIPSASSRAGLALEELDELGELAFFTGSLLVDPSPANVMSDIPLPS
ncbi:hypothetical protein, partial [Pseudomonas helleri]|uniref:hypothetical protein n=1 Tax=Pseudomonas helleri TaxID=1608996 RepID=UPI001E59A2FB